jgi:hypothetical protein
MNTSRVKIGTRIRSVQGFTILKQAKKCCSRRKNGRTGRRNSVKNLPTLESVITFIKKMHHSVLYSTGANFYASIREPNGKKTVFSVTKMAQLTGEWNILGKDSLSVEYLFRGVLPKKFTPKAASHEIYLSGLRVINIYETFCQFLTTNRIDFMYCAACGPNFQLLSSVEMASVPVPLAQWIYEDKKLNEAVDHLGKIVVVRKEKQSLNLDLS